MTQEEKQTKLPDGWKDWNTMALDEMVEYLKGKYMLSSTGEAKCINSLIEFYESKKDSSSFFKEPEWPISPEAKAVVWEIGNTNTTINQCQKTKRKY